MNLIKPTGATALSLHMRSENGAIRTIYIQKQLSSDKVQNPTYFKMAPRMITPNKLSPPSPATSALSEMLVLLQKIILLNFNIQVKLTIQLEN